MARPEPRELEVLNTQVITPHLRRITLGGEAMASFPADQASAYIKLIFPNESDARGYAVLEVLDPADIQTLEKPNNLELIWFVNPQPDPSGQALLNQVKQLEWLEGQAEVWAACEFKSMRNLRTYFKQERQVPKHHLYISSYWKMGISEDQHKVVKRQDAEDTLLP